MYAFLAVLKTKVLLVDQEEHTDFNLISSLQRKHYSSLLDYKLEKNATINNWSGLTVNIFSISIINRPMTYGSTTQILKIISQFNNENIQIHLPEQ